MRGRIFASMTVFGVKGRRSFSELISIKAMTGTVKNPTYADAIKRLNSCQSGWELLEARREAGLKLDQSAVEAMRRWSRRIGYQTSDFDKLNIVHVAGTKGKGTTCAFVNSMLTSVQKTLGKPGKIGLYTSPHLVSVRERIRINSEPITEEQFAKYFFEVWEGLERASLAANEDPAVKPVYFRYLTLLSFHVFMREKVDTAVYEVGVGGELDSTNIVEKPAVTGVTTLGIDHVQSLGETIDLIAWHKAGIFKPGVPAYSVNQVAIADPVLLNRAKEKNVDLRWLNINTALKDVKLKPAETFQFKNASIAVALTAEVLRKLGISVKENEDGTAEVVDEGIPHPSPPQKTHPPPKVLPEEFVQGLESVVWRARCETKTIGKQRYFLDGAHTEDSLEVASDWYGRTVASSNAKRILIFNQQSLRDASGLMRTVFFNLRDKWNVKFDYVIFCTNVTYKDHRWKLDFVNFNVDPSELRSLTLQKSLQEEWQELDPKATVLAMPTIEDAQLEVERISKDVGEIDAMVTGSFHLVGGILSLLEGEHYGLESTTKLDEVKGN
ncbi:folylpolyglutamate synthase [Amniculicola lignicola CBS 123094]|uniref:Folylpolyglutamate synthase n=1 Tax=Amniculicola lignicola CBS 123094 TaxID=1392246 RepID=A0A6A5WR97_9PLEO|nr:folylpolyglutamate synthase [Amniculicola lignicola CBS 123094]